MGCRREWDFTRSSTLYDKERVRGVFLTSAGDTFRQDLVEMTLEITPERWRRVHGRFKTSLIKPWTSHSGGSTVVPPEPLLVLEIWNYVSVKNCLTDQCEASTSCDPEHSCRKSCQRVMFPGPLLRILLACLIPSVQRQENRNTIKCCTITCAL